MFVFVINEAGFFVCFCLIQFILIVSEVTIYFHLYNIYCMFWGVINKMILSRTIALQHMEKKLIVFVYINHQNSCSFFP